MGGIIGRGTASSAIKNSTSVGSVSGASNVGQIVGSGAVVYTTAEVFPEITALSGGTVSDIRKISDANGYMLRGSIEVGLEDTFIITFATAPNLRVYLDNVLLLENEGYTVADNSISIPMPESGVHKLAFVTQEADDNLNAVLVVDAAPYAAMPSLTLKHGEETINLNANNNSYFTNYNDDSGKNFIVEVGDYDPSVTLNVSMSPASYQAADYYDAVNRRYVFPGSAFTEDVAVEFVASQEGLVDKTIKFTLKYSPFSGGLGSAESPYLISKAEQFLSMANDAHYLIINDIDFSHIKTWSNFSLGRFTLDGGNHSLIGLGSAPNSNFYGGLFSFVSGRCVIKNLNLVDVDLTFTQAAGVLIGKVYSDDNSRKTQATEVTITNCHANGVVSTSSMVCGLVGESTGSGNKIFISNSSVDLAIKGDSYVGGFVGTVWDGEVSITDCIIDGTYSGSEYVGGAIGYAKDADGVQIDNVINYAAVNASSSYGAGFIGYGTSACAVRNTINASRIIGSGSDLHAISNVGEFFPEYAAMPEIAACSSGNLSNIVKTYEGASLANQFLQLDSDISSFSVTFAAGTDFSNMAVYLDSALLASSDYAIAGDTVTVTFTPGSHKILFVFSEADKESSVFYVDFAKSYTLVLAYDDREGTVVGTANGSNYTFNIGEAGNLLAQWTTIELTAAAKEGFTFIGWTTSGNEIISYDATYTFDLFRDVTITPLFYQENPADVARIRSTGYGSLEAALADAVTGNIVILLQDYTLTQNITVPQDVMLLLPCGANDYVGYMDTGFNPDGTSTDKSDLSVLYKTLTVPEGVTVTIEGTVLVNAVTGRPAAGTYLQDITGGYSQINLAGNIVVAQGGLLDVFGKITGTGMIEALAGGSVGDLYVVKNWRGGSQAADCYFMNIFPFNEYDLHNIEASLKINSGASYYGNVKMYASYRYYYTRFYQFDGTKGLIKLATGAYAV
ncbi:MAG: hypothetical protein PHD92_09835, partial [Eubacteriales bacterium]|nr:hypothetical protein [Eubacteriales bacterium]